MILDNLYLRTMRMKFDEEAFYKFERNKLILVFQKLTEINPYQQSHDEKQRKLVLKK
jgi:hypothetical protein